MLEGLEAIDWARLTHAYGPADDVPDLLRALAASESDDWDEAIQDVFASICHQGTVYESTAFAVPFLIELLGHAPFRRRHWVLLLLGDIARGSSGTEVHWEFRFGSEPAPELLAEIHHQMGRERGWVAAAREAVIQGFDRYLACLDDPDPLVRINAPSPLVICEQRAAEIVDAFWRLTQTDPDPRVRACALLGIGVVNAAAPDYLQRCDEIMRGTEHEFVVLAAACALGRLVGPAGPQQAIDVLCHAILNGPHFSPYHAWLPWGNEGHPKSCLQGVGPTLKSYATSLLLTGLASDDLQETGMVLMNLIDLTFERPRSPSPATLPELRAEGRELLTLAALRADQRALLQALLRIERIWGDQRYGASYLRQYHLPHTRQDLAEFLNPEQPSST